MKRFVEGKDRPQATLLPDCVDDYVGEDNPVRAIDAFVDALDLAVLGFEGAAPEATGRPAYHPGTLLKIYLYGYLNRIQSSRRLEREAHRNLELMWLTGRLAPDFKTIADFRKDNGPAIRATCRRFVLLCRELDLFSEAVVAVDGSKFKAVNNRDKNFTPHKLQKRIEQVEASIARYLAAMEAADRHEDEVLQGEVHAPEGEDRLPPRAGAALPRHGACGAGRAGPADLANRPGCALHGDERQGHRHRRLQRAGGRGHEAPPDRRARGDEHRQRPRPALGDGRAGPRGDGPGGADGHRRPRLLRRRGDPRLRSGPA